MHHVTQAKVDHWFKQEGARLGLDVEAKRKELLTLGNHYPDVLELLADWLVENGAEPFLEWSNYRPPRRVV